MQVGRSKYGEKFNFAIDSADEMYHFIANTGPQRRSETEADALYFGSGEHAFNSLKGVLRDQGLATTDITSMLEFACGHGRITRFLVTEIDPEKITVSDVDHGAVAFTSRAFNTSPLVSVEDPADFVCDRKFHLVFVASLFTHLSHKFWRLWLERLYALLQPGGSLIFSTHGPKLFPPEGTSDYLVEDGFWFKAANYTKGRLDPGVYGGTWVTEEWVRKRTRESGLGEISRYYPERLWSQDVYLINRP